MYTTLRFFVPGVEECYERYEGENIPVPSYYSTVFVGDTPYYADTFTYEYSGGDVLIDVELVDVEPEWWDRIRERYDDDSDATEENNAEEENVISEEEAVDSILCEVKDMSTKHGIDVRFIRGDVKNG